jgi:RNA-directed DNA polymerase
LGISYLEDKIVELAVKRVLEPIFESVFEDSSYGYRPGCNQYKCLDALDRTIQQKRFSHVVEADIKGFFDEVNHAWLIKFLRHKIADERVVRLIIRMLKSGIMEDGLTRAADKGTPQGSILWHRRENRRQQIKQKSTYGQGSLLSTRKSEARLQGGRRYETMDGRR